MSNFALMVPRSFLVVVFTLISICLFSQDDGMHNINLQSSFLYEFPGGDLVKRYGPISKFEFKTEYLSNRNFAFYFKAGVRINQNVKEDILASTRTSEGFVIGVNGFYADVFGRKRGYDLGLGWDKLVAIKSQFLRFGIAATYTTHWINFVDDSRSVPQIEGLSGHFYDRFVSGFGIEENLQFQYNTSSNRAGFLLGLQIGQAFTTEHRYELLGEDAKKMRLDLYYGIKLTYLLPLYTFSTKKTIYY